MTARIYSPARNAMQSGKAKTGHWVLESEPASAPRIDPLMGYTSSADTRRQVRLSFESLDDAVAYARRNGIDYRVHEPKEARRRQISYAENFRYDRKIPWTH